MSSLEAPPARRLASEAVVYTTIDATQSFLALLVVPASLFWLSPADMGTITLATLGSQVVTTLAVLGLDFALIRFYYTWAPETRQANVRGILRVVTTWSVLLTIVAVGVLALMSGHGNAGIWFAAISAGTGLAVRQIPMSVFRVSSALWWYAALAAGGSLAQAALQIALLATGAGATGFLAGASVAAWATAVTGVIVVARRSDTESVSAAPNSAVLRLAAWNLLSGLANRALSGADRLAVYWWSSIDALGIYGTAARWSLPLRMFSGGTKLALAPALSRGESDGNVTVTATAVSPFVTLLALLAAGIQVSSWSLLLTPWRSLIGDFQRLLAILVVAQLLGCLALIGQTFLYYLDRSAASSALSVLTTLLTFVGLLTVVPKYGAVGAAAVQLVTNAAVFVVLLLTKGGALWLSRRMVTTLVALGSICVVASLGVPILSAALSIAVTSGLAFWSWRDFRNGTWLLRPAGNG
jgi:O-antigen/teichoic acid export membrane protein